MGQRMTDASSATTPFAEGDFRVGRVLNRTASVFSRNFLPFFVVIALAYLPVLLVFKGSTDLATASAEELARGGILLGVGVLLMVVLSTLSQAIVLYSAFQDMRGRPINLLESLKVGLRRFFPIVVLAICVFSLAAIAAMALIFPAFMLITMWFVATPACVVERLGPIKSMGRSRQLTKGHRWKIFGLMIVMFIAAGIASSAIAAALTIIGGSILAMIGDLIWNGIWGAFYAIAVVVTYHDLRVAKEGIDIEQIAAVFE
jgi:MFS family permease